MPEEIVKVQVAIAGTHLQRFSCVALVYGKSHKNAREQPIPEEVYRHVSHLQSPKAYYYADWDSKADCWNISTKAPSQSW